MKKEIEQINAILEEREAEARAAIKFKRQERAELEEKIRKLEKQKESGINNLDDYKAVCEELRTAREYINYMDAKSNTPGQKLITELEYKAMNKQITAEAAAIQAETAPIIEKKLNELIELMDAYTDKISELETVADRASRAHCPYSSAGARYCNGIDKYKSSPLEWFNRFVYMYYSYADTAARLKAGKQGKAHWSK